MVCVNLTLTLMTNYHLIVLWLYLNRGNKLNLLFDAGGKNMLRVFEIILIPYRHAAELPLTDLCYIHVMRRELLLSWIPLLHFLSMAASGTADLTLQLLHCIIALQKCIDAVFCYESEHYLF